MGARMVCCTAGFVYHSESTEPASSSVHRQFTLLHTDRKDARQKSQFPMEEWSVLEGWVGYVGVQMFLSHALLSEAVGCVGNVV
ncbi:hypothetical protein NQZ68_018694 [Dissostichus eleginoides]|nr:hypothetical protein NQZ68_018694 [Dissostichus eleginoides]